MKFRSRTSLILILVSFLLVSVYILRNSYRLKTLLSYSTRPLWDTSRVPTNLIHNFATSELFSSPSSTPESICRLHHNSVPRSSTPEIWDALIFANELEMLELHISELANVVDRFVILESNVTYSGQPKKLYFEENKHRFEKWMHKISHKPFLDTNLHGFSYTGGDFSIEAQQRNAMTSYINSLIGERKGTLVVVSDVDEIPYVETMKLLKMCKLPMPLHLQLTQYVYSFEWMSGDLGWWHNQVHEWTPGTSYYKHNSISSEDYLVEAGVHCSFCFKYISDFQFKMGAYSHWDRLGDNPEALLDPNRIQRSICEGEDIFGMLPEAYTFVDLFRRWKGTAERIGSSRSAPSVVRVAPEKYAYLLPGGCKRELKNPV